MKNLRVVDVVQQHVGYAQQIGQLFLLNAIDRLCVELAIRRCLHLCVKHLESARQKAARATRKVSHSLAELGRKRLGHKVSHRSGRIKLAGITCGLQVFQDGLVNFTEGVALFVLGKVNRFVNLVDDLTKQNPILHVVIGVSKCSLDDNVSQRRIRCKLKTLKSLE